MSLHDIVGLDLLSVLYEQLVQDKLTFNVDPLLEAFVDFSNYHAEELVEDLQNILLAVNGLVQFDIIGILYRESTINWANTAAVTDLINAIFGLNYLEDKEEFVIELVNAYVMPIEVFFEYADGISFAHEGQVISNIYCEIAGLLGEGMKLNTANDLLQFRLLNKYLTDANAQYIVNVLRHLGTSGLFEPAIAYALPMVAEMLDPELQFLAEPGKDDYAGLVADYNTIVDILQLALDMNIVDTIFHGYDFSFEIESQLHQIIHSIFGLNYLDIDGNNKLDLLLEYVVQTNNFEDFDLEAVNWHNEQTLLKNVISKALGLLNSNEIYKLSDINKYFDSITDENNVISLHKLLSETNYKDMILEEWEGYLLVIIDNKVYLADSRGDEYSTKYEWFVWELNKNITCTRVKDGVLYMCTNDGIYTLTNTNKTRDVSAYWTTPLDEFNYPHYMKTTNKRGCVTDINGTSVNIAVRTDNGEFEDIVTHTDISSYVVNRIKKKKWKGIQLKFSSNKPFELYSSTLEAYIGGYVKRQEVRNGYEQL